MRRAAIVAPLRTPVGKFLGALQGLPAERLAAQVIQAVITRSGADPARIDDVVFAQSYANSEAPCIGRWAALAAGLPIALPGFQLDRRCGGGLQSIVTAAMMVETGAADVVLAGGVESMSNIEYYTTAMRGGARAGNVQLFDRLERGRERSQPVERFGVISGMIETAENLANDYGISREAADRFAVQSHKRAAAAWASGIFAEEVVPVEVPQRKGVPVTVAVDEGVRADADMATLGMLKPIINMSRRPYRSAKRPTAGEASATMTCGSTMQRAINRLGLVPWVVSVPLMSINRGAFANVNSIAHAQKINSRRSASTLKYCIRGAPACRGGARRSGPATADRRNGSKATSAGRVSAAVRKNTARSDTYWPQAPIKAAPTPLPIAA